MHHGAPVFDRLQSETEVEFIERVKTARITYVDAIKYDERPND